MMRRSDCFSLLLIAISISLHSESFTFLHFRLPTEHVKISPTRRRQTGGKRAFPYSDSFIKESLDDNIQGLVDRSVFLKVEALHKTIRNLQKHLPTLLQNPLSPDDATQSYQDDVILSLNLTQGNEIIIASNRNEIIALSSVIVAANRAANQLSQIISSSFIGNFLPSQRVQVNNSTVTSSLGRMIRCDLAIQEFFIKDFIEEEVIFIDIIWSASVPSSLITLTDFASYSSSVGSQSNITGQSRLSIGVKSAKVAKHVINSLDINGRDLLSVARTAESIASSLRDNIKTIMVDSKFLQSIINSVAPIETANTPKAFSSLRNAVLQQVQQQSNRILSMPNVVTSLSPVPNAILFVSSTLESTNVPIDDYFEEKEHCNKVVPFPGTQAWDKFSLFYKIIENFYHKGVPSLAAGSLSSDRKLLDLDKLFDDDATLESKEGIILLSGTTEDNKNRVANMYQNLSRIRYATNGDWKLKSFKVINCYPITCLICWETSSPISIRGEDEFILQSLNMNISGNENEVRYRIFKVKQRYLEVNNFLVQDMDWIRAAIFTIEQSSTQLSWTPPENLFTDLLRRQMKGGSNLPLTKVNPQIKLSGPPKLSITAAAAVYDTIRALYVDIVDFPNIQGVYPGAAHISERIVLRGLIEEAIVSGRESYGQVWNVVATALKTLLSTDRIHFEVFPKTTTVILTQEGTLRAHMMLQLRIDPILPIPLNSLLGSKFDEKSAKGISLKFELLSDYKLNENGEIIEHRLCESKINGRLTPGDVLSKWLISRDETKSDVNAISRAFDFMKWIHVYNEN